MFKLDLNLFKCIFLEHLSNQKKYKCYSPLTKRSYISMIVSFFERQSYLPKLEILEENMSDYQLLDMLTLQDSQSIPPTSFSNLDQPEPEPLSIPNASLPN